MWEEKTHIYDIPRIHNNFPNLSSLDKKKKKVKWGVAGSNGWVGGVYCSKSNSEKIHERENDG